MQFREKSRFAEKVSVEPSLGILQVSEVNKGISRQRLPYLYMY